MKRRPEASPKGRVALAPALRKVETTTPRVSKAPVSPSGAATAGAVAFVRQTQLMPSRQRRTQLN